MRTWNLKPGDVARWRLAADARLPGLDHANDQIWEVAPEGGEPPALAIETTYGLRARGMRIFPTITAGGQQAIDPATFAQGPAVHALLPNYMLLSARPIAALQMGLEYWVHDSHALIGRLTLTNHGEDDLPTDMRLSALLLPGEGGAPFSETQIDGVVVLAGSVGSLAPVVFLEGGARTQPSAFPSLGVSASLAAGRSRSWVWAHAAEADRRSSFDRARLLCSQPWEPNLARLKLLNASLVEVETGDPDWDAAFWLTQVAALQSFTGPTRRIVHPGMVGRRSPRDGFSASGDGSDYDGAWGGIDASQAHYISSQLLSAAPDLVAGELRNRFRAVHADGCLDGRPGPGGQRAGWESMPLLADLTWRTYEMAPDRTLLEQAYPVLLQSMRRWFSPACDHDQDGFPEWRFPPQTGYEAWPAFVAWQRWGQGLEISKAERPDLAAYLLAECAALAAIAGELGEARDEVWLQSVRQTLQESLEQGWSDKSGLYQTLDRDLNQPLTGERLGRGKGEFKLEVKRTFESPVRVLVRVFGEETQARDVRIKIQGKGRTNRKMVEEFSGRSFQWFWKMGTATAEKTAKALDWIRIEGLDESFTTEVWLADTTRQDASGLLPLWTGTIPPEHADRMIEATLLDEKRFWRRYGIPTVSARDSAYHPEREGNPGCVWMFANTLLGEGLLRCGYRSRAAELVGKLMPAVLDRLRREGEFGSCYHPDELSPLGDDQAFEGLAPLSLFLATLGLKLAGPGKVRVEPGNPYPWPVSVSWRGLTVEYQGEQVVIRFPDGASVRVTGQGKQWVEQE